MTLQNEENVSLLDPFTHTTQNSKKIRTFDFVEAESKGEKEKVRIEETYCTLVTVGGKFLEKKAFKNVLKKVDEIRKISRNYPFSRL